MSGFVYAPYIPLFRTPSLVINELRNQPGFEEYKEGFILRDCIKEALKNVKK